MSRDFIIGKYLQYCPLYSGSVTGTARKTARSQHAYSNLGNADTGSRPAHTVGVIAEQDIHTCATRLRSLEQRTQIRAWRRHYMTRPVLISAVNRPPGVPSTKNNRTVLSSLTGNLHSRQSRTANQKLLHQALPHDPSSNQLLTNP